MKKIIFIALFVILSVSVYSNVLIGDTNNSIHIVLEPVLSLAFLESDNNFTGLNIFDNIVTKNLTIQNVTSYNVNGSIGAEFFCIPDITGDCISTWNDFTKNPFDQSLNTTDDVDFNRIYVTYNISSNRYIARSGSASDPTYKFSLNEDMGMYRVGNDLLGFTVNGNNGKASALGFEFLIASTGMTILDDYLFTLNTNTDIGMKFDSSNNQHTDFGKAGISRNFTGYDAVYFDSDLVTLNKLNATSIKTTSVSINGTNISFHQLNESMMLWAERAAVAAGSYWALGNGQVGQGLPIPRDNYTAGNLYITCHTAVDNRLDVELYVNQASTGCIVNYTTALHDSNHTYCGVDLSEGDQVGCYVLVEDATYTNCVCSLELTRDLGEIAAIKGAKGEQGDAGEIQTDEVSAGDGYGVLWNGTNYIKVDDQFWVNASNNFRYFGIGYTYFDDYVIFDSEPTFDDGIKVNNYANFYDNVDHHNYDIENVGTIYSTYVETDYLTYSGSDPEIVGWFPISREKIKTYAEIVFAYDEGIISFFNNDTKCYELFEPSTGNFYKDKCLKDLEIVETVDPILNNDTEEYYKLDSLTGDIIIRKRPKYTYTYKLGKNETINQTIGQIIPI